MRQPSPEVQYPVASTPMEVTPSSAHGTIQAWGLPLVMEPSNGGAGHVDANRVL